MNGEEIWCSKDTPKGSKQERSSGSSIRKRMARVGLCQCAMDLVEERTDYL